MNHSLLRKRSREQRVKEDDGLVQVPDEYPLHVGLVGVGTLTAATLLAAATTRTLAN
jgi:hypothetical protein